MLHPQINVGIGRAESRIELSADDTENRIGSSIAVVHLILQNGAKYGMPVRRGLAPVGTGMAGCL